MRVLGRLAVAAAVLATTLAGALTPADAELGTAVYRTDGVDGNFSGATTNVIPAQVWDLQVIGNTVYAAGQFTQVVSARGSWPRIDQPFLAAFDATSGRYLDWWRPVLDAPAWALDVAPDGSLLVGGEFDHVNGTPRSGLVALDARTGAIDPTFYAEVLRPNTPEQPVVRDLHRDGNRLYVVGNFSRVLSGNPASPTRTNVTKAARLSALTGVADPSWAPVIAGRSAWAVATSDNGNRVHLGGEFSYVNGAGGTSLMASVDALTGANLPGWQNGSHAQPRGNWPLGGIVYDLGVYGNNLFVSGAEHYWEQRDATTGAAIRVNTSPHDTQRIEVIGDRVYIGCHCYRSNRALQIIEVSGATGQELRTLGNSLIGGDGAWAFAKAPDGCLWSGGDFRQTTQLVGSAGTNWVGRFARLCDSAGPLPHNVPSLTAPPPPPDPNVLIARRDPWRYLADGTHPLGWAGASFAEGAWPTGSTELGYGDGGEATVIPRTGLSALFRRTFEADPAAAPYLELRLSADDGATVWINGRAVVAENMPSGVITADTSASSPVSGAQESDFTTYRLPSSVVHTGTNSIAVSVHQSDSSSVDLSFDLSLTRTTADGSTTPTPDISLPSAPPPPPAAPTELVPTGATWRYVDDGSNQGTAWRSPAFDDGGWASGPAMLGFEVGSAATVTRTGGRPVTAYFRHQFALADAAGFTQLTLRLLRDDGAVVYLNGIELLRDNMPSGTIISATNASSFVTGAATTRFSDFTVPAGAMRSGTNVIAVEVHQALDSKDLAFDLGVTAR
jgi:trimeric autotransporter adhesin